MDGTTRCLRGWGAGLGLHKREEDVLLWIAALDLGCKAWCGCRGGLLEVAAAPAEEWATEGSPLATRRGHACEVGETGNSHTHHHMHGRKNNTPIHVHICIHSHAAIHTTHSRMPMQHTN